jgi:glutamate-1-semialdehyde 2,1-aminomutase
MRSARGSSRARWTLRGLTAHTQYEARFASRLRPLPGDRAGALHQFGHEANLMAVAAPPSATGRRTILGFEGGYHGSLLTSGRRRRAGSERAAPGRAGVPTTISARGGAGARPCGRLAAILEPMLVGGGGCIPASPASWKGCAAADETARCVYDEVMTSRLSPAGLHGARRDAGLVTLGKYVGGGMSFGAFGGRAALMAMFNRARRRGAACRHLHNIR